MSGPAMNNGVMMLRCEMTFSPPYFFSSIFSFVFGMFTSMFSLAFNLFISMIWFCLVFERKRWHT